MATCGLCIPWNLPLTMLQTRSADGANVGLSFHHWIAYHQHVVLHQAGNWAGEIEAYVKELLDNPKEIRYS